MAERGQTGKANYISISWSEVTLMDLFSLCSFFLFSSSLFLFFGGGVVLLGFLSGFLHLIKCFQGFSTCSMNLLARLCSKSFKPGFSNMWTKKFQMYKLGLENSEEPEIKFPTLIGSCSKQKSSRKTFCFIYYAKSFDCVNHNKLENS